MAASARAGQLGAWATLRLLATTLAELTKALARQATAQELIAAELRRLLKVELLRVDISLADFDGLEPGASAGVEYDPVGSGADLDRVKVLEQLYVAKYGVAPPVDWDPDGDGSGEESREESRGAWPGRGPAGPPPPWAGGAGGLQ